MVDPESIKNKSTFDQDYSECKKSAENFSGEETSNSVGSAIFEVLIGAATVIVTGDPSDISIATIDVINAGKSINSHNDRYYNGLSGCLSNRGYKVLPRPNDHKTEEKNSVQLNNQTQETKKIEANGFAKPKKSYPKNEEYKDCEECPIMIRLSGGNYNEAKINSFSIGKYEITQQEWSDIMGGAPSENSECGKKCPIENISWIDAKNFLRKLSEKTGFTYRMPTEAEWMYACKGHESTKYCGSDDAKEVGWIENNSTGKTKPVGEKKENSFGIHDMTGNVWELVADCISDCKRVVILGGWAGSNSTSLSFYRNTISISAKYNITGLRVVRD